MSSAYTLNFSEIGMGDAPRVGAKNASLGELFVALKPKGVGALDGFAITTDAYWRLLDEQNLRGKLEDVFSNLNPQNLDEVAAAGYGARTQILQTPLPDDLGRSILDAYHDLVARLKHEPEMAVRSSASAVDLPEGSIASAAETYLNVRGQGALLRAVHQCFASLFTDRAISDRARQGYPQLKIALSVGVMPMVSSDLACSGLIHTLDAEPGFCDIVRVSASYGLGEFLAQGGVTPDEWLVFKPSLRKGPEAIVGRRLGSKEIRLTYDVETRCTRSEATPPEDRARFCLEDSDVHQLAEWACLIEEHFSALAKRDQPIDIEWAKDGITCGLFILQAGIRAAHADRESVEFCGRTPSDFPEFPEWLVAHGIDSKSLNPDASVKTTLRLAAVKPHSFASAR
jgi:pyruvate,water dikinase